MKRSAILVWFISTAFASTGFAQSPGAPTTQPTAEDRIRQLEEKVAQLEQQQKATGSPAAGTVTGATAITERSEAGPGHPQAGLDPLDTTAQLKGRGPEGTSSSLINAIWDGNQFVLSSFDGNFTLHPGLTMDIRNDTSFRERVPAKGAGEAGQPGYDTQNGFDIARLRLVFDGTLFHQVGYFFQFSADQGSALTLLDAYATYQFGQSPWSVKAGQFKDPYWHERNVSEANQLAVDRSLLEYFMAGGQGSRVQGAAVTYDRDRLRGQLVIHDGFNTQNTKFFDAGGDGAGVGGEAGVTPTNFGFSGRAEYMLIGDRSKDFNPFTEYDQFTSLHARQRVLVVGAGADFTQASSNDLLVHAADVQFNDPCGFSAYAAYLGTYRALHTNQGVAPGYYYNPGFVVQAAYVINQRFEPFVRYDYIHFDPASTAGITGLNSHLVQELTLGVNWYIFDQKLKATIDGSWLPNGSPGDADALGVLRDSGRYEFVLRAQLQFSI